MFWIVSSVVLLTLLLVSVYVSYRFAMRALVMEDNMRSVNEMIEQSLDTLDESYRTITQIAGFEVVSDEPFVRRVVESIVDARLAIGKVALKLGSAFVNADEDEDGRKKEESNP